MVEDTWSLFSDGASLEDYVDTPDESSSYNGSGPRDGNAMLSDSSSLDAKGGGKVPSSSAGKRKLKADAPGIGGTVLATSGVSRRLDFSKDRISKALSVVRSKKEGMQP